MNLFHQKYKIRNHNHVVELAFATYTFDDRNLMKKKKSNGINHQWRNKKRYRKKEKSNGKVTGYSQMNGGMDFGSLFVLLRVCIICVRIIAVSRRECELITRFLAFGFFHQYIKGVCDTRDL